MKVKNTLSAGITALALILFLVNCDNGTVPPIVVEPEPISTDVPLELIGRWYTSQAEAENESSDRVWEFTQDNKATTPDTGPILFDVTVTGNLISISGVISLSGKMKYHISENVLTILESSSVVFKPGKYYKKQEYNWRLGNAGAIQVPHNALAS